MASTAPEFFCLTKLPHSSDENITNQPFMMSNSNYTSTQRAHQLSLFDPAEEAALYLPPMGGYFALLTSQTSGKKCQSLHPVSQLETVLRILDPKRDSWISQTQFWTPLRRVVNVKSLSLNFLDVDYYKTNADWARGKTPEQVADAFMSLCDAEDIPRPSIVVHSGRGIQPKWLYSNPIPRRALPRWNAVEQSLVKRLAPYGVDSCARDAARVLRVVRTVNSRSGTVCRVAGTTPGKDGKPLMYSFEELCEYILPKSRLDKRPAADVEPLVQRKVRPANGYDAKALAWARLEDLRTLCAMRGGIREGMRMNFLMYSMSFLALSGQVDPTNFYREAAIVAQEIDPIWTYRVAELSTIYEKMCQARAGQRRDFNGRQYVPLYTPRSQTLIDLFEITTEEMQQLTTIVTPDERRRRDAASHMKQRRAQGVRPRAEYLGQAQARKERAKALYEQGMTKAQIARDLGLDRSTITKYLKC